MFETIKNLYSFFFTPLSRVVLQKVITALLVKFAFYGKIDGSPPLVAVQSHINPVHTLQFNMFKINFNIVFLQMPAFSKHTLPFRFSDQID
jgi:hypothetical protein